VAGNVDWGVDPAGLTVPPFAGPNDPAVQIGDATELPAALIAAYLPDVVVAGTIYRQNSQTYTYDVLVDPQLGTSYRAVGGIESIGLTIAEMYRIQPFGFGDIRMHVANPAAPGAGSGMFIIDGDVISGRVAYLNVFGMTVGNTAVAFFQNLPGNPSVTINKRHGALHTQLEVVMSGTFFTAGAAGLVIGVNDGTTDHNFTAISNTNPAGGGHSQWHGILAITGLGNGNITLTPRWRRSAGAGTIHVDAGDVLSMSVKEVAV
jgi:hypothetical protein